MTTYVASHLHSATQRFYAVLTVLILAGVAVLIAVLATNGDSNSGTGPATNGGTHPGKQVQQLLDCRPGPVPRPC